LIEVGTVLAAGLMLLLWPGARASAQPALFGSVTDPAETLRSASWDRDQYASLSGGLSLIGPTWRTAGHAVFHWEGRSSSAHLAASLRAGLNGRYSADFDEAYDLVRLIDHARINPTRDRPLYLRIGPLRRMRLGQGHLVDFLSSETAWDERRIGAEVRLENHHVEVSGFSSDLRFGSLVGGRVAIRPFARTAARALRTLQLAANAVTDLAIPRGESESSVTAWQTDARFEAVRSGAFALLPFVSYASFRRHGRGVLFGADLDADNFIDVATIHFRLAVHYSSIAFAPGYFGAFYPVHGPSARIVATNDPASPQGITGSVADPVLAGIPLESRVGGNDVLTELRVLIFDRFEFWHAFKRHYGGLPLSEWHFRLFLRTSRMRIGIAQDRAGLTGLKSLFEQLGDLSILRFHAAYRVLGAAWIHAEARYTYERIGQGADGTTHYLVRRQFEPSAGIRIRL
jgi:hypothetical protein